MHKYAHVRILKQTNGYCIYLRLDIADVKIIAFAKMLLMHLIYSEAVLINFSVKHFKYFI